jgi:xanthine dehydrogenase accessory factor
MNHAPLVIALGPGFSVGKDAHYVVETNRGHRLGRLLLSGVPNPTRVSPAPCRGSPRSVFCVPPATECGKIAKNIGDLLSKGDIVGTVQGRPVSSKIDGILRGSIRPGILSLRDLKSAISTPEKIEMHATPSLKRPWPSPEASWRGSYGPFMAERISSGRPLNSHLL